MSKLRDAEKFVADLNNSTRDQRAKVFHLADKRTDSLPPGPTRDRWKAVGRAIWNYAGVRELVKRTGTG